MLATAPILSYTQRHELHMQPQGVRLTTQDAKTHTREDSQCQLNGEYPADLPDININDSDQCPLGSGFRPATEELIAALGRHS